ncbi:hypothetical protein IW261DRAFT_1003243 [Armillaria novae-zelandiae]|uniref:Protein kinase domain-containing protein n=1 Tax=Armillaria novae-zelandiae TaxID=153914 RepID=A0AA39NSF6_9AGAR|nr:hypothetical protein IW261DRAFT_1003243 [Armillaria novae-zelandiae]
MEWSLTLELVISLAHVSLYTSHSVAAIEPIVQTIAKAAGLQGSIALRYDPVGETVYSQRGDVNIIVEQQEWFKNELVRKQRVLVCSDEDRAYSVLLSKAESLSSPLKLDATKEQTNAKAMAVKLALQMVTAGADYGFFFGGFIAIVAPLVHSTDPSHPGTILLLSPVFKLQNETLPDPHQTKLLTPFQANIPTEPFLAILVAILCSNMLPQHRIKSPTHDLCQPLTLGSIPDEDETEDDVEGADDNEEDTGGSSDIPMIDLQVAANAMILHYPWLKCSDIHRISVIDPPNIPPAKSLTPLKRSSSLLKSQYLLQAPRFPSTNVDVVTLVDEIRISRWSSVWKCRVEGDAKLRIMKLVGRVHVSMVLRELYMYEVALKNCPLIPVCYGVFQRPDGGWFGFLLEDVGDNLEEAYGMDWSDIKRGVSATEWQKLIDSVFELHSLGVMHGDLEPRNVAQTVDGFKFFDFGRSKLHVCQRDNCGELQDLLEVY